MGCDVETFAEPEVQLIDHQATEDAPEGSHQDVEGIMDAKIDATVTCQTCIQQEQQAGFPTAEEEHEEDAQAKRVGGMTGDEAIESAPIVVDQVDDVSKFRFLRRAQSVEVWLAEAAGKLVAECHKQSDHDEDEQDASPLIVPDDCIKQAQEHGNPRWCLGNSHHGAIEEKG